MQTSPSALYVHIPFCQRRCDYCGFVSSTYSAKTADAYLQAVTLEIEQRASHCIPRTIYIGGGTPSSLNAAQLHRLFTALSRLPLRRVEEWTIEANPGTLTVEKVELFKRSGVNRVSLGIQTFQAHGLLALGRHQDIRHARAAIALLREIGLENISADLIYGWPGQKPGDWQADLAEALRLRLPHISCYSLTYEEGTPLAKKRARGEVAALSEEEERTLFDLTSACLAAGGMRRYEISNYAWSGWECRHNLAYWRGEEYIGIGAAAHSHIQGARSANVSDIGEYIDRLLSGRSPVSDVENLPPERKARECAVIWLRLSDGIDAAEFALRTGYTLEALFARELPRLLADGWLIWSQDHSHLRLADKALPVADLVLAELI